MKMSFPQITSKPLRTVFIIILVSSCYSRSYGQKNNDIYPYEDQKEETVKPSVTERLFFGGSLGLQFGSLTDIKLSPVVGYWVLPRIAVAAGPTYRYYNDHSYKTVIYGGKTYIELLVISDLSNLIPMGSHTGIFLHVEDEFLSLKTSFWKEPPYMKDRFWVNTVLLGPGLSQQIGKRSSLNFTVLWPLTESGYPLYSKPDIRVSFIF